MAGAVLLSNSPLLGHRREQLQPHGAHLVPVLVRHIFRRPWRLGLAVEHAADAATALRIQAEQPMQAEIFVAEGVALALAQRRGFQPAENLDHVVGGGSWRHTPYNASHALTRQQQSFNDALPYASLKMSERLLTKAAF